MKKHSIRIKNGKGDWEGKKLTIGMDLGDRTSRYCVLDQEGEVLFEGSAATTQKGLSEAFGALPPAQSGFHSAKRISSVSGLHVIRPDRPEIVSMARCRPAPPRTPS